MTEDTMFFKYDLNAIIAEQRQKMLNELDRMPDDRLISNTLAELSSYCFEKYKIDLPVLGEPQVDEKRSKMIVGRYGGDYIFGREDGVKVDSHLFTLEIPYVGDEVLFWTRGNSWNTSPPRGGVNSHMVWTSVQLREPDAAKINQDFEAFIAALNLWLGFLKGDIDSWNTQIPDVVRVHVEQRRARAEKANAAVSGLKFALKARADTQATFTAPVARKRIEPVLPKPVANASPEPVLTDEAYRDILDTIQQMSEVMERSPHAFASMDEETLRFQFLVPLNARFEGDARGEVFNYGGKTDILITHKGRNIFVAELKVWSGAVALSEAIDQLLGYLTWRDTKTALIIFNRNKNLSDVLAKIDPTMQSHPNYISTGQKSGATEFRYTFSNKTDAARRLTLTVLVFDLPK